VPWASSARPPSPARGLLELGWPSETAFAATKLTGLVKSPFSTTENKILSGLTHYNNFYEFGTGKGDPAKNSKNFNTSPWSVSVEGEIKRPGKFTMDGNPENRPARGTQLIAIAASKPGPSLFPGSVFPQQSHQLVDPTPKAEFVAFQSYFDPQQMPQARYAGIDFPLCRSLRMDEAMNPLALLSVGMYGETLPIKTVRRCAWSSLEVRVQEREVHRQDQISAEDAADNLEPSRSERIRLLFQRESRCRPPADGPSRRNAASRNLQAPDAHVQWLCRSGCRPV